MPNWPSSLSAELYDPAHDTWALTGTMLAEPGQALLDEGTGLKSAPQTVAVTNVSGDSVKFSSIGKSGDYVQTNTCPVTLAAGQNCSITVTFQPTAAGTRNGAVTLTVNWARGPQEPSRSQVSA